MGHAEQDRQNGTGRTGQPDKAGRTGQAEWNRPNWTSSRGHANRTGRIGEANQAGVYIFVQNNICHHFWIWYFSPQSLHIIFSTRIAALHPFCLKSALFWIYFTLLLLIFSFSRPLSLLLFYIFPLFPFSYVIPQMTLADVWTPDYTPTDRLTSWGVLYHPCTVPVNKLLFISQ
jgi:hypothetical protein